MSHNRTDRVFIQQAINSFQLHELQADFVVYQINCMELFPRVVSAFTKSPRDISHSKLEVSK